MRERHCLLLQFLDPKPNTRDNKLDSSADKILIIVAGPVGLTLAIELNRRQLPFSIIDQADAPALLVESRALVFNTRSQTLLEASHQINGVNIHWKGGIQQSIDLITNTAVSGKYGDLPLAYLLAQNRELEYSAIRRPIAQKVLAMTHRQTMLMNSSSLLSSTMKHFGPKLLHINPIKQAFLKGIFGVDTPAPEWIASES